MKTGTTGKGGKPMNSATSRWTGGRLAPPVLLILASAQLVLGAWAAIDARSFARTIADFGPANLHLVHDYAAASLTFGVALLLAWRLPGWRRPMLTLTALWNGLHAISHLVDMDHAASPGLGILEFALLGGATLVLGLLALHAHPSQLSGSSQSRV